MKVSKRFVSIAAVAATAIFVAAAPSKADVVCNSDGDCWHVAKHYTTYPASLGVTFYPDTWREEHVHDTHYHWYDRDDDSGYYLRGEWHAFERSPD